MSGTASFAHGCARFEIEGTAAVTWGRRTLSACLSARSACGADLAADLGRLQLQPGRLPSPVGLSLQPIGWQQRAVRPVGGLPAARIRAPANPGLFIDDTLEAGNPWTRKREVSLSDLRIGSSLFGAVDTSIGPLYVGVTYAPRGQSGVYLFLGRP